MIKRARDNKAIPKGQWAPVGELALVRCPDCGTGMAIARDHVGEVACPRDGCIFACTTANLEHFEIIKGTTVPQINGRS